MSSQKINSKSPQSSKDDYELLRAEIQQLTVGIEIRASEESVKLQKHANNLYFKVQEDLKIMDEKISPTQVAKRNQVD